MKNEEGTQELDLSGLNCPLPVLKTKKKLSSMDAGERLFVVCTDQGSFDDLTKKLKLGEKNFFSDAFTVAADVKK